MNPGQTYDGGIPGHSHVENQSANSELLNTPFGSTFDVLLNAKDGNHFWNHEIARISVAEIHAIQITSGTDVVINDRIGNPSPDNSAYTFRVEHKPTCCNYPHCEIVLLKDGAPIQKVPRSIKKKIKIDFGTLAKVHQKNMENERSLKFDTWQRSIAKFKTRHRWIVCGERFLWSAIHVACNRLRVQQEAEQ
jgi:hypothetical protein